MSPPAAKPSFLRDSQQIKRHSAGSAAVDVQESFLLTLSRRKSSPRITQSKGFPGQELQQYFIPQKKNSTV